MRGDLQQRIKPMEAPKAVDFGTGKAVKDPTAGVEGDGKSEVDFLTVMRNSQMETKRERAAKENGDDLAGAKDYDDFLGKLSDKTKKQRVPKNTLEKDDFLKLFVTQLQHQDPLNPEDSTEMASRLAHFNSLEQMLNVNKNLEKMFKAQTESRGVEMVNYIGKEVSVDGGRVKLTNGQLAGGTKFKVDKPASNVVMQVRDAAGSLVMERQMGNLMPGEHKLEWDGKNNKQQKVGDGVYTYSLSAQGQNAEELAIPITSIARITGIDIKDTDGAVYTDLGKVKMESIKSIGDSGFTQPVVDKAQLEAIKKKLAKATSAPKGASTGNPVQPGAQAGAMPGQMIAPPKGAMNQPGMIPVHQAAAAAHAGQGRGQNAGPQVTATEQASRTKNAPGLSIKDQNPKPPTNTVLNARPLVNAGPSMPASQTPPTVSR